MSDHPCPSPVGVFARRALLPLAALGALSLVSLVAPRGAHAQSFTQVVVFGDSLSDDGNLSAVTAGVPGGPYPKPPYFNGRMSNGPVWVENLTQSLGLSLGNGLDNYAVIGARTDSTNVSNSVPGVPPNTFPGIQTQVTTYITAKTQGGATLDADALYVVWGGANDYLNGGQINPAVPVENITGQLTALAQAGARRFLVPNLPNLGALPGTRNTIFAGALSNLTTLHNGGLQTALTQFQQGAPNVSVTLLDVNLLIGQVIANPAAFGFTNVTDNYVSSNGQQPGIAPVVVGAGDPNNYLFWDEIHPTAPAHGAISNRALFALTNAPEPGTLALAGVGMAVAAAGAVRRRRRKAAE